ncbi:hypothetical protein CLCHR_10350 [Clostridium chromiireducens]|uniref:Uncharacterized protein n=1 Tax=Clostridium chromiireducens TaxID=225345 RepID=A0A1V4IX97_9CLOT|nr:hypothetical protein CLCHR_10350 [Clostridium chromiireducens]
MIHGIGVRFMTDTYNAKVTNEVFDVSDDKAVKV